MWERPKYQRQGSGLMKSVMMGHQAAITSDAVGKYLITWENVHDSST